MPTSSVHDSGAPRAAPEDSMAGASRGALTFRSYRPADKAALLKIVGRVWGEGRRRTHEILWDWQHGWEAVSPEPRDVGQVMELDGRIIGYSGAVPVEIAHADGNTWGCVLVDTFVDPAFRGFGRHLMQHHIEIATLALGAPIVRVHPLWKRLCRRDSIIVRSVRKRIRVIDVRPFLRRRGFPSALAGVVQVAWSAFGRARRRAHASGLGALRLERVERFPEAIDAFGREFARGFRFSALPSASFLNWRYVKCPVSYEKWLLWDGDTVVGCVVYRAGTMNGRPVLLLIEALAIREVARHYGILLAHVERAAVEAGVCDIQTLETGCPAFARELTRWAYLAKTDEVSLVGCSGKHGDKIYEGGWFLSAGGGDFEFTFFNQGVDDLLQGCRSVSEASGAESRVADRG